MPKSLNPATAPAGQRGTASVAPPASVPAGFRVAQDNAPADWRKVGPRYWPKYARLLSSGVMGKDNGVTTPTGTFPGTYQNAFCLTLTDGRVFCGSYSGGTTAYIYNPIRDTLTSVTGWSGNLGGQRLLPNGSVIAFSTTAILEYDPATGVISSTPIQVSTGNVNSHLLPSGKVAVIVHNGTYCHVYDPKNKTIVSYAGFGKGLPSQMLYDGTIVINGTNEYILFNPEINERTTIGNAVVADFNAAVLLDAKKLFLVNWTGTNCVIVDVESKTITTLSTGIQAYGYFSGRRLSNDMIFLAPCADVNARLYSIATGTFIALNGSYQNNMAQATLLFDGRLYSVPYLTTTARIWNGNFGPQHPALVLSSYFNGS